MRNQLTVSAEHLELVFEQVVSLAIDTSHLALALQAVEVDCAVSAGILNSVRMALQGNAAISEDISDQLDSMLSARQDEVSGLE
ncbi:hypothetical protein [Psychrobacter sp. S1-30-MNA-CIBAN-0213]|uniref:hypothetical protein n=1 Tax=Psychrobacter sp. S1-30-MNA-CIBAN-0213 TaxID=3140456 RepID=UPI003325C495